MERDAHIVGCLQLCMGYQFLQRFRESLLIAQYFEANTIGIHVLNLFFEISHEQAHQATDLFGGTFPVFCAESKKTQVRDAHIVAGFDDIANPLSASCMAEPCRHETVFGPAPIAIHDDGNVLGQ